MEKFNLSKIELLSVVMGFCSSADLQKPVPRQEQDVITYNDCSADEALYKCESQLFRMDG